GCVALSQAVGHFFRQAVHCYRTEPLTVEELQAAMRTRAERVRLFQDHLEHRRQVTWRGINDAEDFSRRGLLLQRHLEIPRMSLAVAEEADIVDSDDRLGGECPQQLDLLAAECYRLPPHDKDKTDGLLFAHHRHCEDRSIATRPQEAFRRREARV